MRTSWWRETSASRSPKRSTVRSRSSPIVRPRSGTSQAPCAYDFMLLLSRPTGSIHLMGEEVTAAEFSREDRQRYREKVRRSLDVFARMLAEARFDAEHRSIGLEIELNLTDEAGDPAMKNAAALEAIADEDFQTELGQFNVEINIQPRLINPTIASELEADIRRDLNEAESKARSVGAHMVMVGILPTLQDRHLT